MTMRRINQLYHSVSDIYHTADTATDNHRQHFSPHSLTTTSTTSFSQAPKQNESISTTKFPVETPIPSPSIRQRSHNDVD
ncbi:unnamed protein product, partial [Didymodactylos carnosus]